MRDILTVMAGLLILVLAAAVAVPPFVDWSARRDDVDRALSRAAGIEVGTQGAIGIRFLPTPRLTVERLRLGAAAAPATLDASDVSAEIGLTPLLHGEVRFLDTSAARVEVRAPRGTGLDWPLPRVRPDGTDKRNWAFDDIRIGQLAVTTTDPATGRTDHVQASGVRLQAQALAGPWRLEGVSGATPFEFVTGEAAPDGAIPVKANASLAARRIAFDGAVRFLPAPGAMAAPTDTAAPTDAVVPTLIGTVRVSASIEGTSGPRPATLVAQVKAAGLAAELDGVAVEAGEGAGALRLAGTGRLALDTPRLALQLDGRRLDLDATLREHPAATTGVPDLPVPVDLALRLDSVALGGEELTDVSARASLDGATLRVDQLAASAPGTTRAEASGTLALGPAGSADGRVRVTTRASDRLAAYLAGFGLSGAPWTLLDGRPATVSADLAATGAASSARNLRVEIGDGTITGLVRHSAPSGPAGRGRVDAQLALRNLDLSRLVEGPGARVPPLDFGLTIDGRGLRYGGSVGAGRVTGRIETDASAVTIERLEIADLAGANGSLSGRIGADGQGRIEGRLTARQAAPLIDLVGRPWLGRVGDLVPAALRNGEADLRVLTERAGAGSALRTSVTGRLGGGPMTLAVSQDAGRVLGLSASLATDRAAGWLGLATSAPARPGRLEVEGERDAAGRLGLAVSGELAGLRIATAAPALLGADDAPPAAWALDLAADDLAPVAAWLGPGAAPRGAVSFSARLDITAEPGGARGRLTGRLAGRAVTFDLAGASPRELSGTLTSETLSLPWLASAFALGPGGAAPGWSSTRFAAPVEPALGGRVRIEAAAVDLGGGLSGTDAAFDLATNPDGFAVSAGTAAFGGGTVAGGFTLTRQGGLAAFAGEVKVRDVALPPLVGAPVTAGALTGDVRFGASGESPAALVANLGGAGTVEIAGLDLAGANPAAPSRAAGRALRSDDPLAAAPLSALVAAEIDRAPLRASRVAAPATMVGGVLRLSPLAIAAEAGGFSGVASVDLRSGTLDLRGSLQARESPKGWNGAPPALGVAWTGPFRAATRAVVPGPLTTGLAQSVLARELDRVETFELDAAERARQNARTDMDRARRAAEEAARQARLREEAERARAEAERVRMEAERNRIEAERARAGSGGPPPLDIRPPVQLSPSGG